MKSSVLRAASYAGIQSKCITFVYPCLTVSFNIRIYLYSVVQEDSIGCSNLVADSLLSSQWFIKSLTVVTTHTAGKVSLLLCLFPS